MLSKSTANEEVLIKSLRKIPEVKVSEPKGAFYCIVKLPVNDAEDFSKFLLTSFIMKISANVSSCKWIYSTPGIGKNEVRIAFILDCKKLIRAVKIIKLD